MARSSTISDRIDAEGVKRSSRQVNIPPHELVIKEGANSRRWVPNVDDLVESILTNPGGQVQDIVIRIVDDKPVVEAGERRALALKQIEDAGLADPPIMARCTIIDLEDEPAFLLSIAENHQRQNPTPIDDAYAISRLVADKADGGFAKTQQEVAKAFGKSIGWVSQTLALAKLPVAMQKDIHRKKIRVTAAYELAGLEPAQRKRMIEEIQSDGAELTAGEIKARLRKWSEQEEEARATAGSEEGEEAASSEAEAEAGEIGEATSQLESESDDSAGEESASDQAQEKEAGKPKREKKNKRVSKSAAAPTANRSPRALKELKIYFEQQAATQDEDNKNTWAELCGEIVAFMSGKLSERQMTTRGKTACGMD